MTRLVLASASPRRIELIKQITDDCIVCPSECEEKCDEKDVMLVPVRLAEAKAAGVAVKYPDFAVIGADTVVVCDGEIFGKPKDDDDAERMLTALSGKHHSVVTGVCVISGGKRESFSCATDVRFYELSREEILAYIRTGEPSGKAGAYAIQGRAAAFVMKTDGDMCNIIGLPVMPLKRKLKEMGILHI